MAFERQHGRRWRCLTLAALALVIVVLPLGWVVSDRLEQQNDFCNACHLPDGTPLHQQLRRDFDAVPAVVLASVHGAARIEERHGDAAAFRCFDCHAGSGFRGRTRVKLLAAWDGLVYLSGRFEEPTHMAFPLEDSDCAKCHTSYPESEQRAEGTEGWSRPFHAVAIHNTDLEVTCVSCHLVHERGGSPDAYFLRADVVRDACAQCHARSVTASSPRPERVRTAP